MKKITFIMLVFTCILMLSISAQARQRVTYTNVLIVDMVRYDPSPVRPGFSVDIWFEVSNIAKESLDIKLDLVEEFPFTVVDGPITFTLGVNEKKQIKYTVNVNSNAQDQSYSLFLQYFSEKANTGYSQAFAVPISRGGGVEVGVTTVNIDPEMIPPGDQAKLSIIIENNADYLMKDMTVELNLEADSIPFAPFGTTSKKKIREILVGSNAAVEFDIIALPTAEAGIYKVPLIVQYYDELGHSFNKSELLGLTIGSEPDVYVEIKEKEIYSAKGTGDIVLNIVNKGLTDIKFLKVTLDTSDQYDILSSSTVYIGDVDSDDEETSDFKLRLKGASDVKLLIRLEYRDANNRPFELDEDLPIVIYSKSELGMESNGTTWTIVIVVILAGIGIWYYYRRKRRRQK